MNPKVSVIIPAYNSASYIGEAVRSVLGQSYHDLEVLVADDGSTDHTAKVVEDIRDARVRFLRLAHAGNYFTRNSAIRAATGTYLAFLDADDFWTSDKLEKQLRVLDRDPEMGLCCTDHYLFYDDNCDNLFKDSLNTYFEEMEDPQSFIQKMIRRNCIITSSVVVRKECVDRVGLFDTAYQNAMDYGLWLRVMLNYKASYLKDRCVMKRIHRANISQNAVNSLLAVDFILRRILDHKNEFRFYTNDLDAQLREKLEMVKHSLGLEYLAVRDFDRAAACLASCHSSQKKVRRSVALWAARVHFDAPLRWIQWYRKNQQNASLQKEAVKIRP